MSIKKSGAVLVAVLALTAIVGSSASAAVETKPAEWYTGASPGTTLAGDLAVTAKLPAGTKVTLVTTIAGLPVEISSEEIGCIECKITNEEVTGKAGKVAVGDGRITFSKVKLTKPANCTIQGINADGTVEGVEMLTTRPLKIHADWMDTDTANLHDFQQFSPKSGTAFAAFKISGAACGVAGNFNVTGTLFGESANNTGVQAAAQTVGFNSAVQTTTGAALKFGANAATLTGSAIFEAGGTTFGIH
jgi:hypothetical protein